MTAIPKALAMANPKHVAACVATVTGVISSKFAIDAVANKTDQTERQYYDQTDQTTNEYIVGEYERMARELTKCSEDYEFCCQEKDKNECHDEYILCQDAIKDFDPPQIIH